MRFNNKKMSVAVMGLALSAVLALGGCATTTATNANSEQSENRSYMTEVNQTMETLESRLASFNDAVSREDVVSMRTQADNAFKTLDQLAEIEAPSALENVHKSYVSGTSDLKQALNDYIDLYTEIQSATDDAPFDWSGYDSRIAEIKSLYDQGVDELKSADDEAAKLPN